MGDTAGKSENQKNTIKAELKTKSDAKLKADITDATSAKNMKALQAKLKSDLSKELKPAVEAELRAKVTANQDTKDEAKIAAKTQDAGKAAKKPSELDVAESFKPDDDDVVEFEDTE